MGKRIISQRRGRGNKYSVSGHRFKGEARHPQSESLTGKVISLKHDPGRTAPIAEIVTKDGKYVMIAHEGMFVGQEIKVGRGAENEIGDTVYLGSIPEGTKIYNLELRPGDGGKMVRAAGEGATIASHGDKTTVKLPSRRFVSLNKMCRATIGVVAGGGRKDKPKAKASKNFYAAKARNRLWPIVRGVAMNAVDHPHGSGRKQTVGVSSSISRNAPPGRKVGNIAPKRTGKK